MKNFHLPGFALPGFKFPDKFLRQHQLLNRTKENESAGCLVVNGRDVAGGIGIKGIEFFGLLVPLDLLGHRSLPKRLVDQLGNHRTRRVLQGVGLHVALHGRSHINLTDQLLNAMNALETIRNDQSLPPGQRCHRTGIGQ